MALVGLGMLFRECPGKPFCSRVLGTGTCSKCGGRWSGSLQGGRCKGPEAGVSLG